MLGRALSGTAVEREPEAKGSVTSRHLRFGRGVGSPPMLASRVCSGPGLLRPWANSSATAGGEPSDVLPGGPDVSAEGLEQEGVARCRRFR